MTELETLARTGRNKPRTSKPEPKSDPPKGPTFEERGRTKRALVYETGLAEAVPLLLILACAGLGALIGRLIVPTKLGLGVGVSTGVVLGFVAAFGGYWTVMFRREVRWLRNRPFRFDVDAYLLALGAERGEPTPTVTLRVRFEEPLPEDAHALVRDAGAGMHPRTKAKLTDGELVLRARIPIYRDRPLTSDVDGDRYPTHEVHDYVRHVFEGGLSALHARFALREVALEIS